MKPFQLITPSRLDVFARTAFARAIVSGAPEKFGRDLYIDFLSHSSPREYFAENGHKVSLEDYIREFRKLIESMKSSGFDESLGKIPVSAGSIVNGAHRLATALVLGLDVAIENVFEPQHYYDQNFLDLISLPAPQQDFICHELVRYCPDVKALVFFGMDKSQLTTIETTLKRLEIATFYKKRVPLTEIGMRRSVKLAYDHNDWWNDSLQETMTIERFTKSPSVLDVFFIKSESTEEVVEIKKTLRSGLEAQTFERKIHGTDFHFDTQKLADGLLNSNALHFLNRSPIGSENEILRKIKLVTNEIPKKQMAEICIDGSSVMEIYGIRKARDVDLIALNSNTFNLGGSNSVDLHNREYSKYPMSPDQVISDPRMHLVVDGFKFLSLNSLQFQKSIAIDEKSSKDLSLISAFEEKKSVTYVTQTRTLKAKIWRLSMVAQVILDKQLSKFPDPLESGIRNMLRPIRRLLAEARKLTK